MPEGRAVAEKRIAYAVLYNTADHILKQHNPCQIQRGDDGVVTCIRRRESDWYRNTCCGGCNKLGPNGCTVDSLDCKLWMCQHLTQKPEVQTVVVSLAALRDAAKAAHIPASAWRNSSDVRFEDDTPSPHLQRPW